MNITNGWMPEGATEAIKAEVDARASRWEDTLAAFDNLEAEYRANPTETITLLREGFKAVNKRTNG